MLTPRIRPALPWRYRLLDPREHSMFVGRAQYGHGLRVPLEEHVLVMAGGPEASIFGRGNSVRCVPVECRMP